MLQLQRWMQKRLISIRGINQIFGLLCVGLFLSCAGVRTYNQSAISKCGNTLDDMPMCHAVELLDSLFYMDPLNDTVLTGVVELGSSVVECIENKLGKTVNGLGYNCCYIYVIDSAAFSTSMTELRKFYNCK